MTNLVLKNVTITMANGAMKGKADIVIKRKVMKGIVKELMGKPQMSKPMIRSR